MEDGLGWVYAAYLAWLVAGLADFILHWRTDLRHTSGIPESAAHLVQLAILGSAIVLGLLLAVEPFLVGLLIMLVIAHACVGYLDSRVAFVRRRTLYPVEQHVHSILDMAPLIGLGILVAWTWPAAITGTEGWLPTLRRPLPPLWQWFAIIAPAIVLCVVPALLEFRAAWRTRFATDHAPPA